MAIGQASGDNRAQQAAEQAIHSALLDMSIEGAQGILFNVTGGADLACTRSTKRLKSSSAPPTPTPTSSSAPWSTRT